MSIFTFLGPSLAVVPLCIMNAWGALDTREHWERGPLLWAGSTWSLCSHLKVSGAVLTHSPLPAISSFVQTDSGPSQSYLFCTNCSFFHGKPCIWKCPMLWPLDECFEVFLLHRHRRQISRAALKLSYPVGKYTYQSNTFSNKLGFSSWSFDGAG